LTTEHLQNLIDHLEQIQADLEADVKAGPQGSLRREALAMATGWLAYVQPNLRKALEYET
jgi:hypothetical protein